MIDITEHPIWGEVQDVIDRSEPKNIPRYSLTISSHDADYGILKMGALRVSKDYFKGHADVITVEVQMWDNVLTHELYPEKENLTAVVIEQPSNPEKETVQHTYRAVLLSSADAMGIGKTTTANVASKAKPVTVVFQLLKRAVEDLRVSSYGMLVRDQRTDEFLQGLLTLAASKLSLPDDELLVGVDMVKGDNDVTRNAILIDTGTDVFSLAHEVQNECGGIYLDGINHYIQDNLWYVYPNMRTSRFDKEKRSLTVVNLPENRMPFPERSWFTDGEQSIILGTGDTRRAETSEKAQLRMGNGVRFGVSKQVIDRARQPKSGKVSMTAADNFVSLASRLRKDTHQFAPMSKRRHTDNVYREQSEMEFRFGEVIEVQWQNASLGVVYPGMPVKYAYMLDDNVIETYGQVIGLEYEAKMKSPEPSDTRLDHMATLRLYLEKPELPSLTSSKDRL